ncbi:MAG: transporter [Planctomycetes bacterium]|nr:transporter [Planctomycetota bacterium]
MSRWMVLLLAWAFSSLSPSCPAFAQSAPDPTTDSEVADDRPPTDEEVTDFLRSQNEPDVMPKADDPRRWSFWPVLIDRATHTVLPHLVPRGVIVYEFGISRTVNDDEGVEVETDRLLETTIRSRAADHLEFRLGFSGYISEDTQTTISKTNDSGYGDLRLGSKVSIATGDDTRPAVAIVTDFSIPTGSRSVSSRRVDPSFRLSVSQPLGKRSWSFIGSAGIGWVSDRYSPNSTIDTLSAFEWSAGVRTPILSVEFIGDAGLSRPGGPRNSFRVGSSLIQPSEMGNLQTDLWARFGLSEDADDWAIGLGFSFWRKPKVVTPAPASRPETEASTKSLQP